MSITLEQFYEAFVGAEVEPLLGDLEYDIEVDSGLVTLVVAADAAERVEAQLPRIAQRGLSYNYRRSGYVDNGDGTETRVAGFVFTPEFNLALEAGLATAKSLADLKLVALIANPKTLELLGVYRLGARSCLLGRPVIDGVLDVGNPARRLGQGEAKHTGDVIGIGYLGNPKGGYGGDKLVAGAIRAHCPKGVSIKEQAYGTCLYVGLAALAAIKYGMLIGSAPKSETYGPRYQEADEWWENAINRGLAQEVELDDIEPEESDEEETSEETGTFTFSRGIMRSIRAEINEEIDLDGYDEIKSIEIPESIDYEYTLSRTVENEVTGVAGVMSVMDAIDQGLVLWLDLDGAKWPDSAAEYLEKHYVGDFDSGEWKETTVGYINTNYAHYLERFRFLKPNSAEPAVLNFLREVLTLQRRASGLGG